MFRQYLASGLMLALTGLACVPVLGQDYYLNQLYGQGVHAFNRGQYTEAERLLDEAIQEGIRDPRAYYFRALTRCRTTGHLDSTDVQTGARLELEGYNGYDIGISLQRVQGSDRMCFERMRRDSIIALQRSNRSLRSDPSAAPGISGTERLRSDVSAERSEGVDAPTAGEDATDPFQDDAMPPGVPAVDATPNDDSLFNDEAGTEIPAATDDAMDTPADDDLFSDELPAGTGVSAEASDDSLFSDDTSSDAAGSDGGLFGDDTSSDAAGSDGGLFDDEGSDAPPDLGGDMDALFP